MKLEIDMQRNHEDETAQQTNQPKAPAGDGIDHLAVVDSTLAV
jgi:hypothetical protein